MSPALVLFCIGAIVAGGLVLEYFTHRETYRPDQLRQRNPRRLDSSGGAD
jgi:hypothetical protein